MLATSASGASPGTESSEDASANAVGSDSSAVKVLRLLDAFVGSQALIGLTELAKRADLPKSTAHRLLRALTREDYVRRVGARYCLSNRVFEVGNQVMVCRPNGLREQAMPFLAELFFQTRQTVHLAVLQDSEVLYLEKIFGNNSMRVGTAIGGRRPAHATALGKAILAFSADKVVREALSGPLQRYTSHTRADPGDLERHLTEIRDAGFAADWGECIPDLSCVAAPIRDPMTGRAIAAVSVSTPSSHDVARRFGRSVVQTATELSRHISTKGRFPA